MDQQAQIFWDAFITNRMVNKEFYRILPEDKYDFRMVDDEVIRSDSPRESLIHLIAVTRDYIAGVKSGELTFKTDLYKKDIWETAQKEDLLKELDLSEAELLSLVQSPDIAIKMIKVPWSGSPVPAIPVLYGLSSHEILHTGWNLAIMDHLHMPRFEKLIMVWGN